MLETPLYIHLAEMQVDPELATFLEEAFHSTSPTIAARRPPTAAAAATNMLTLGIDDELTEEEELVGSNHASPTHADLLAENKSIFKCLLLA